jgi:hypothetical protein
MTKLLDKKTKVNLEHKRHFTRQLFDLTLNLDKMVDIVKKLKNDDLTLTLFKV